INTAATNIITTTTSAINGGQATNAMPILSPPVKYAAVELQTNPLQKSSDRASFHLDMHHSAHEAIVLDHRTVAASSTSDLQSKSANISHISPDTACCSSSLSASSSSNMSTSLTTSSTSALQMFGSQTNTML